MQIFVAAHTGLLSLVSDPISPGVPYRIVGSTAGSSWLVSEGTGIGASVRVSDPGAPFGAVTYTVTAGATVDADWIEYAPSIPYDTDTVLFSEDGRSRIAALWEGNAARTRNAGASYQQPLNSRWPVQSRPLSPGGPSWAFQCRVPNADVPAARAVFDRGRVWVIHSLEACTADDCPLPPVMLAGVDGDEAEGSWTGGRTFGVSLRQLEADRDATGVPVVTWGEARAAGIVWGPSTTFESIRHEIAGGP